MVEIELVVVSYNIYMDGYKDLRSANKTILALVQMDADLVCLQECSDGWRRLIESNHQLLGARYPHMYFHSDIYSYGGRALLSKHPIIETQFIDRVLQFWYGALWAKIQLLDTGVNVAVLNLHLRAPFPGLPHRVQHERRYELEQFWNQLDNDKQRRNLLVVGDMNTARGLPHQFLQENGFVNALRKSGNSLLAKSWTCLGGWFGFLFDHIYYDRQVFKVTDAKVLQIGSSDHWPLMAKLLVRSPDHTVCGDLVSNVP